jgi:hypothetical protein
VDADARGGKARGDPVGDAGVFRRLDDHAPLDLGQGRQQRGHLAGQAGADVGVVGAADRGDEHARAVGRQGRQPGEFGQHLARDRVGAAAVGVDREHRQVLVDR